LGLPTLLGQVLLNRGYQDLPQAKLFFEPESWILPDPALVFVDLAACVERLALALIKGEKIAICGDYDCDGMTSTALLIRALRILGVREVNYLIPDRLQEGYGINERIVQQCYDEGYRVLITVDNGISALNPLRLAQELDLAVIITDHHDLPPILPPALGILNPKLIDPASPYHSLAGVGMAYVLAVTLADKLGRRPELEDPLLELFTLGTIADMAPLVGVNRSWTQRGLRLLPLTQNPGIRSLMTVAGFTNLKELKPEAIGFGLGPRINAVGRIGDPCQVITLLTTDDPEEALACALACEKTNLERQTLLAATEAEALALVMAENLDLSQQRVLIVAQTGWHPGIVGLVASRLKERTGCPTFVGVIDEKGVRGSARGIPEFNIFAALSYCRDYLGHFGGHPMAGGFSCSSAHWPLFQQRLIAFAQGEIEPQVIKPLVEIDAEASLSELSLGTLDLLDRFHPCGMHNPDPVFWSAQVKILKQRTMGKTQDHARLTVSDGQTEQTVVAWRWGEYLPLPEVVDIAYKLQENIYQGKRSLQLVLEGLRPARTVSPQIQIAEPTSLVTRPLTFPRPLDPLAYVRELSGPTLLYGYGRPELPGLDYDRPRPGVTYEHLVFWTLPPSPLHLDWLVSRSLPQQIHCLLHPVPLLPWEELLTLLEKAHQEARPLNLLALGQKYWLSPRSLLVALHQ
jgi:single-stranded-DNA-specific exonuclease